MPHVLTDEEIAEFRARVCHAAEVLLAAGGPGAVSMRAVAAKLGVSPMTPYRYFESKEALVNAVRVRAFERLAKALEAASPPAGACQLRVGEAYVAFAAEHPAAYRLMFEHWPVEHWPDPALATAVGRARSAMSRHLERSLEQRRPASDAQFVGDMFWAALHGLLALDMVGKLSPAIDPEKLRAAALTAIARGLADRRPRPSVAPEVLSRAT